MMDTDNKYTESLDQPYPLADRCLDFVEFMKSKTEDDVKFILSLAMSEAFDHGFKRGLKDKKDKSLTAQDIKKACDKGYEDGKKDGIQEGLDRATAAIKYLDEVSESEIYSIFNIGIGITDYPFDYVLDNYDMNTIVTKVNNYIKQQNEPCNAASKLIVDISNQFKIPVADVVSIIGIYEDKHKSTE